jgi:hypothetical protein
LIGHRISNKSISYRRSKSHLGRIIALADFLDTVRGLVCLCNEVRHADDFILLVIFNHICLFDYRHKVFSMANLALQSAPDLWDTLSVHQSVMAFTKAVNVLRHKIAMIRCAYLVTRQDWIRARWVDGFSVRAVDMNHDSMLTRVWIALFTTRAACHSSPRPNARSALLGRSTTATHSLADPQTLFDDACRAGVRLGGRRKHGGM